MSVNETTLSSKSQFIISAFVASQTIHLYDSHIKCHYIDNSETERKTQTDTIGENVKTRGTEVNIVMFSITINKNKCFN